MQTLHTIVRPAVASHLMAAMPGLQSTRVLVNPLAKTTACRLPLTDRQRLEKRARLINDIAAKEAKASAPYFRAVSMDLVYNIAGIRKRGEANVIHFIDLNTGECSCCLQAPINNLNSLLIAERSETRVVGKCMRLVNELETMDPECLLKVPHPSELLVSDATEAI